MFIIQKCIKLFFSIFFTITNFRRFVFLFYFSVLTILTIQTMMNDNRQIMIGKTLLICLSLMYMSLGKQAYFKTIIECKKFENSTCEKWDTNTSMFVQMYTNLFNHQCFPSHTYVLTEDGPKVLEQIAVGDRILGHNFESDRPEFTDVQAWLHRDTSSRAEFTRIKTVSGHSYVASDGHHLGFNDAGTIGFKYADQFEPGDQLFALTKDFFTVEVASVDSVQVTGLFSPYTSLSNFYFFASQNEAGKEKSIESLAAEPMVLAHCLAQVGDPLSKEHWVHTAMSFFGVLGLNNHENKQQEQYLHPVTHLMAWISSKHRTHRIIQDISHQRSVTRNKQNQKYKLIRWTALFTTTMNSIFIS